MLHSLASELPERTDQEVFTFRLEFKYARYSNGIETPSHTGVCLYFCIKELQIFPQRFQSMKFI